MEVDGGWHFSRSSPPVVLGRAVAKWRALEMRGWRVVSVPWHQWRELATSALRQEYLANVLDGVLWRTHQTSSGVGRAPQSNDATAVR